MEIEIFHRTVEPTHSVLACVEVTPIPTAEVNVLTEKMGRGAESNYIAFVQLPKLLSGRV